MEMFYLFAAIPVLALFVALFSFVSLGKQKAGREQRVLVRAGRLIGLGALLAVTGFVWWASESWLERALVLSLVLLIVGQFFFERRLPKASDWLAWGTVLVGTALWAVPHYNSGGWSELVRSGGWMTVAFLCGFGLTWMFNRVMNARDRRSGGTKTTEEPTS